MSTQQLLNTKAYTQCPHCSCVIEITDGMTKENTFEAILCSGCNQIFWFSSNGITMKKFTENDWEGILNLIRLQALQEENIVK